MLHFPAGQALLPPAQIFLVPYNKNQTAGAICRRWLWRRGHPLELSWRDTRPAWVGV